MGIRENAWYNNQFHFQIKDDDYLRLFIRHTINVVFIIIMIIFSIYSVRVFCKRITFTCTALLWMRMNGDGRKFHFMARAILKDHISGLNPIHRFSVIIGKSTITPHRIRECMTTCGNLCNFTWKVRTSGLRYQENFFRKDFFVKMMYCILFSRFIYLGNYILVHDHTQGFMRCILNLIM